MRCKSNHYRVLLKSGAWETVEADNWELASYLKFLRCGRVVAVFTEFVFFMEQ